MRDVPFTVGVEQSTIFLFQKLAVRVTARFTGSPLLPALAGQRSTSSSRQ